MNNQLIIGTRGSILALWQAKHIQKRLEDELNIQSQLQIIKTKGDKILDVPLAKIGGKGLFTKELEVMLMSKEIDLAVHSLKDVPVDFIEGLELACITKREDDRDCFLSQKYASLNKLPLKAKVGTTSLRRSMQIKALRPDIDTQSLRGNVQTRLQKLKEGIFDAIILAKAGLNRLNISSNEIKYINVFDECELIPAMGQGALGIEMRSDNPFLSTIKKLQDENTKICTEAERSFVRCLDGGCQVPIGVNAKIKDKIISINAIIGLPDGSKILKENIYGEIKEANELAIALGNKLINQGAKDILRQAQDMI